MTPELADRVSTLGADTRSGASALAADAIQILKDAHQASLRTVSSVATALCAAQPSMAPIWNAAAVALMSDGEAALVRYALRVQRAPAALARVAADLLLSGVPPSQSFSVATVSASGSVRHCLSALARRCRLDVLCAEGRPLFEGRELAASLAEEGIAATVCTDAALSGLSHRMSAVLVGADAVAAEWFVNKSGTRQVAAVAADRGTPVYVVASRDKFIVDPLAGMLQLSGGPAAEVWSGAPDGVNVVNPYFERVPLDVIAGVITDTGVVDPSSLGIVADGLMKERDASRLALLIQR